MNRKAVRDILLGVGSDCMFSLPSERCRKSVLQAEALLAAYDSGMHVNEFDTLANEIVRSVNLATGGAQGAAILTPRKKASIFQRWHSIRTDRLARVWDEFLSKICLSLDRIVQQHVNEKMLENMVLTSSSSSTLECQVDSVRKRKSLFAMHRDMFHFP